jgi:hypothetical protein
MSYAHQKLFQAVDSLVGTGSLRDRLTHAAGWLVELNMHVDQVPKEPRGEYERLHRLLTQHANEQDGAIAESSRRLSDDEARQAAKDIWSLFCALYDVSGVMAKIRLLEGRPPTPLGGVLRPGDLAFTRCLEIDPLRFPHAGLRAGDAGDRRNRIAVRDLVGRAGDRAHDPSEIRIKRAGKVADPGRGDLGGMSKHLGQRETRGLRRCAAFSFRPAVS